MLKLWTVLHWLVSGKVLEEVDDQDAQQKLLQTREALQNHVVRRLARITQYGDLLQHYDQLRAGTQEQTQEAAAIDDQIARADKLLEAGAWKIIQALTARVEEGKKTNARLQAQLQEANQKMRKAGSKRSWTSVVNIIKPNRLPKLKKGSVMRSLEDNPPNVPQRTAAAK